MDNLIPPPSSEDTPDPETRAEVYAAVNALLKVTAAPFTLDMNGRYLIDDLETAWNVTRRFYRNKTCWVPEREKPFQDLLSLLELLLEAEHHDRRVAQALADGATPL